MVNLLNGGRDLQAPDAWRRKLARVYVGNFPHSSVEIF